MAPTNDSHSSGGASPSGKLLLDIWNGVTVTSGRAPADMAIPSFCSSSCPFPIMPNPEHPSMVQSEYLSSIILFRSDRRLTFFGDAKTITKLGVLSIMEFISDKHSITPSW